MSWQSGPMANNAVPVVPLLRQLAFSIRVPFLWLSRSETFGVIHGTSLADILAIATALIFWPTVSVTR